MRVRVMLTLSLAWFLSFNTQPASADVMIKTERHPVGLFQSSNFTVYNDTVLIWSINGREGSLFFPAGTQVAMPWNSSYRFAQTSVISYDQRKLYEVAAGTLLKTPDFVPDTALPGLPNEPADEVHCVKYQVAHEESHCLVVTDREHEGHSDLSETGAYTAVNISVVGNGQGSASARVEGCKAIASSSAVVFGSGRVQAEAVAKAWGCK